MSTASNRKEGELLKYRNVFSGWGKRYFRLERSYLHYFETKHTHEPIATTTRGEIAEVKLSNAFPGKQNCFEIIQKNGLVWYCQAESPEEMVSWMQALSTVPILLDPLQYPMLTPDQEPEPEVYPNYTDENQPPTAHSIHSPYRELIDQAHHAAFICNTPHNCQHREHNHLHHSPPPPYSVGEELPPFGLPPTYQVKSQEYPP